MRCKAHFCNGAVDFNVDERGELCPKCLSSIMPDLNEKIAKKVQQKLDDSIKHHLKLDSLECDDD